MNFARKKTKTQNILIMCLCFFLRMQSKASQQNRKQNHDSEAPTSVLQVHSPALVRNGKPWNCLYFVFQLSILFFNWNKKRKEKLLDNIPENPNQT